MQKLDDLPTLLPSKAKERLEQFFFERLLTRGVNWRSHPNYTYLDALEDTRDQSDWVSSIVHDCFERAMKRYDASHPLCWSNERQRAFRQGINDVDTK